MKDWKKEIEKIGFKSECHGCWIDLEDYPKVIDKLNSLLQQAVEDAYKKGFSDAASGWAQGLTKSR